MPRSIRLSATFYRQVMARLPDSLAISLQFFRAHRRLPNLSAPRSFSEKVQWRKLHERRETFTRLVDKLQVKSELRDVVGASAITPTLWSGVHLDASQIAALPLPFVLKASHSSGQNLFVRTEEERAAVRLAEVNGWLSLPFQPHIREWVYRKVVPQLLAEPFIGKEGVLPIDYKIFVFNRRATYIQVDTGREHAHKRRFYDRNWRPCDFSLEYPPEVIDMPCPLTLASMLAAAESVANAIETNFVRVDLYEISNEWRFGEVTFYPGSGYERFEPREADDRLGALWTLDVS